MKRLAFILLLTGLAYAADPATVRSSQGALAGALNGLFENNIGVAQYIPGYGYHIGFRFTQDIGAEEVKQKVLSVLTPLNSTIEGLEPNDFISVYIRGEYQDFDMLIRMAQNQPETLEVWLDGAKQ